MDRAQRIMESAALVLGLVCFASVASVQKSLQFDLDSCDLGLTSRFVKTVE